MQGSSILPVSIHNNKLYFLFGKENDMEISAPGFSDFGGGVEPGEIEIDTAIRECAEELTGFLGDREKLKSLVKDPYIVKYADESTSYTVHIIPFQHDPMLPLYYNNNHQFLWNRMDKKMLNSTKFFEKIEIRWFSEEELLEKMPEYREFYKNVIKQIVAKLPLIRKYIKRGKPGASSSSSKKPSTIRKKDKRNNPNSKSRKQKGG